MSVQCPFVEDECNGRVEVEIPPAELGSSTRRPKRAVRVGAAKFKLASGAMGRPSVKAEGPGLTQLCEKGIKRAALVFVARDGEGHRRVTRRRIKIRSAP